MDQNKLVGFADAEAVILPAAPVAVCKVGARSDPCE